MDCRLWKTFASQLHKVFPAWPIRSDFISKFISLLASLHCNHPAAALLDLSALLSLVQHFQLRSLSSSTLQHPVVPLRNAYSNINHKSCMPFVTFSYPPRTTIFCRGTKNEEFWKSFIVFQYVFAPCNFRPGKPHCEVLFVYH